MEKTKVKFSPELIITSSFLIVLIIGLWVIQLVPSIDYYLASNILRVYLIIILLYYICRIYKTSTIKKLRLLDTLLLIMSVLGIVSTCFAINRSMAIDGIIYRYEGIFSIITYYALFYTASNIKDEKEKKILLSILTSILVFSCIIGIITGLGGLQKVAKTWKNVAYIPYGNPNFFGTITTLTVAIGLGMFIFSNKKFLQITGIITYILGVMAVYSCDSSSPIVGNIMVFLLIFVMQTIFCIKQKDKKAFFVFLGKFVITLLLYIGLIFLMNTLRGGQVSNEFNKNISDFQGGVYSDSFLSSRMKIWRAAFRELPDYWLHGVGVDNFYYVSEYGGINTKHIYFDKAHNEYIHIMLTEGLPCVLVYIGFLFVLFIRSIKSYKENVLSHSWIYLSCFTAFFAYIAQAFFNIRIIYIAPFFFILCGLLYNKPSSDINIQKSKSE